AHTDDVLSEVVLFALEDGLGERDIHLLAVAAAYHDMGFVVVRRENEPVGARRAVRAMKQAGGYTDEEIAKVRRASLDTQIHLMTEGPRQMPTQEFSKYLLDADVSNLGRDDFFEKAELVRKESKGVDRRAFLTQLIVFVTAHRWYTKAAKKLRQTKKREN